MWLRPVRHAGDVPRLPVAADRRVAARNERAAARTRPAGPVRTAGPTPDPAPRPAVHARADEDRRAVHARHERAARGSDGLGLADVDVGGRLGVTVG